MAKVSRPVVYALLAGAVLYAAVVLTEPDAPAPKHNTTAKKAVSTIDTGFTEADYKAHFPRYAKVQRDAFRPEVTPKKSVLASVPAPDKKGSGFALNGLNGSWTLTGISAVNGVRSALLENSATRESVFIKQGDLWNGLRVISVEANAAVLQNAQGQKTRLTFVEAAPVVSARDNQNVADGGSDSPDPAASGNSATANVPQPTRERSRN